jgi:NADH:ubiquinone oxidoreductase subunit 3 (subunit A)
VRFDFDFDELLEKLFPLFLLILLVGATIAMVVCLLIIAPSAYNKLKEAYSNNPTAIEK